MEEGYNCIVALLAESQHFTLALDANILKTCARKIIQPIRENNTGVVYL